MSPGRVRGPAPHRFAWLAGLAVACGSGSPLQPPPPPPPPAAPVLVKEIPIPPAYGVHDSFVRDGIAFVCAWNTGLIIYDVGNGIRGGSPAHPIEISRIVPSDDGVAGGPAVHNAWWFHNPNTGERRYVFLGQEGPAAVPSESTGDIHVIDVADLAQPREVAFYHMNVSPQAGSHNFWMDEPAQILYAAYYNGGIVALDVSGTLSGDLAAREIARIKPSATPWTWGVQLVGGSLYAVDLLTGLYQLRLSGHSFSVVSGGGNVLDRYSSDLFVTGSYAYTGTWGLTPRNGAVGNAVKIWHLGPTGAPSLVDSIITDGIASVSDVKGSADGKLLVFTTEAGPKAGLYVYDLANPARPRLVASVLATPGFHTVKVADIAGKRYLFAARNPGMPPTPALVIYDVTGLLP